MKSVRSFIDRYALLLAMLVGASCYKWLYPLSWLSSPLIFLMLFFTFYKINPRALRLRRWHFIVLGVQLLCVCIVLPFCLLPSPLNPRILEGLLLCLLMPTATAAPVIAGKLGGSVEELTSFSLLSNLLTAVLVPSVFPLMHPSVTLSFGSAMWSILCRVSPLLIGPFVCAMLVRWIVGRLGLMGKVRPAGYGVLVSSLPFYLWVLLLVVLMAKITHTLVTTEYAWLDVLWLCLVALVPCVFQFVLGRWIGRRFGAGGVGSVTSGQAFGQKNTALGIWLAQMFLHPFVALAPAAYILWQNLINSYQLGREGSKV